MHPADYQTPWALFLFIIAAYVVLSLFILGAKKVYFEPYVESEEPKSPAEPMPVPASNPPTM
jgi:hypothetical protein